MRGLNIFDRKDIYRPECQYIFFIALSQVGMFIYSNDMYWVGEPLRILGVFGFLYTFFQNIHLAKRRYPLSFMLLAIMIIIQTVRILYVNPPHTLISSSIKETFAGLFLTDYVIPSIMPLILFTFWRSAPHLDYFAKIAILLGIAYIVVYPFAFVHMIHYKWSFNVASWAGQGKGSYSDFIIHSTYGISNLLPPFILLFWKGFVPIKKWLLVLSTLVGGLLIIAYLGRRGGVIGFLLFFVVAWMFYINHSGAKKRFKIYMNSIVILIAIVLFLFYNSHFFSTLLSRGLADTRSGVEASFYADMKEIDWLIGRGWFGCYYDKVFYKYRMGIETGFLTLILRGGIFYLLFYLWVLVEGVYRGLFMSKNIIVKAFALYIFIQILFLYPSGIPTFTLNYLILWIAVSVCFSKRLRNMSDSDIRQVCFSSWGSRKIVIYEGDGV